MMERAHVFFESFDSFIEWSVTDRPLFAVKLEQSSPTRIDGVAELKHIIHLSQVFHDVIHHCAIEISSLLIPTDRDSIEKRRARMERAWTVVIAECEKRFEVCVTGAFAVYPKDSRMITAVLSVPILCALYPEKADAQTA